jgi:phage shock protein PspC (stress-responsive transcriptional regulator)
MCARLDRQIVSGMTETTAAADHPSTPLFVRPSEGRMLAGVCAGIARRWNLDVTLVRIATVVLVLLSGVGLAAYIAAWLLTPSADAPAPLAADSSWAARVSRRGEGVVRRIPRLLLFVVGLIVLLSVAHSWWLSVPVGLTVIVAGVLVLLFGTRLGRWTVGIAALLVALLATGIGVAGPHLGTRTYNVAPVDDLHSSYDYGAGTVRLDLSALTSVTGEHRTSVKLGRGDVKVTLPAGVPVLVHARSAFGSVKVNGHRVSGVDAEQTVPIGAGTATATDRLVIDVSVGAGSVTVR